MADTPDLGSGAERYAGSTPAPSTCDLIKDLRIITIYTFYKSVQINLKIIAMLSVCCPLNHSYCTIYSHVYICYTGAGATLHLYPHS